MATKATNAKQDVAGRRVATKGEPPLAAIAEKKITPVMESFVDYIQEQTGYTVDPMSVQLSSSLRGQFQKSERNQERIAASAQAKLDLIAAREQKKLDREAAREERAAARAAKAAEPKPEKAVKAPVEKKAPATKAAPAAKKTAAAPVARRRPVAAKGAAKSDF